MPVGLKIIRIALVALLALSFGRTAFAASASEVDSWSTRFSDAVASGETDQMMQTIDEIRDERVDHDGLQTAIGSFNSNFKKAGFQYTTRIDDQSIGDLYRRFTTVSVYSHEHIYYTTTFLRSIQGWKLIAMQMNSDVNKILTLPWPQ